MSEKIDVWYQLYGEDGKPYQEATPTKAKVAQDADVADFKKAVLAENQNKLKGFLAAQLKVYQRQKGSCSAPLEKIDLNEQELIKVDRLVSGLGKEMKTLLIVVVPKTLNQNGNYQSVTIRELVWLMYGICGVILPIIKKGTGFLNYGFVILLCVVMDKFKVFEYRIEIPFTRKRVDGAKNQ